MPLLRFSTQDIPQFCYTHVKYPAQDWAPGVPRRYTLKSEHKGRCSAHCHHWISYSTNNSFAFYPFPCFWEPILAFQTILLFLLTFQTANLDSHWPCSFLTKMSIKLLDWRIGLLANSKYWLETIKEQLLLGTTSRTNGTLSDGVRHWLLNSLIRVSSPWTTVKET